MRITNRMMTNNMLYNINNNKRTLNGLEEKYATGLAIQRPSDDPIVAVRALKLRTNLSELNQYYEKNIPDAKSWMETTESALKVTSEIITKIHTYCVQGANDTLTEEDRRSIAINLQELKSQVYQEGNANYAGRYLFTGYKTNTPLVFGDECHTEHYTITETITSDQVEIGKRIVDTCPYKEFDLENYDSFDTETRPNEVTVYRLRLSYDNVRSVEDNASFTLKIPSKLEDGTYELDDDGNRIYTDEFSENDMISLTSTDPSAYKPEPDEIHFLADTGEIILGSEVYDKFRNSDFEVTYEKQDFEKNELRPEHYFDCVRRDLSIEDEDEREEKAIKFTAEDQKIAFEINFNQQMAINIQGREAFRHSLGRTVDDIVQAISDVDRVKDEIEEVKLAMKDDTLTDEQVAKLNDILSVLNTELDLKDGIMRQAYAKALTAMSNEEDRVNVATADIGTRYNRLELTESRLSTQQTEFTDLLSQNEDADLVDTVVNYNAMQTVYNASLSSAAKVVQNTLLDFL
ncbi:MAG: flagellar hook-associated protein FlgL [Lachnospiraceae bacterium]|nr:flagellar hook-associated protein FlgL [Lachnospiraceae bacterium]